MFDDMNESDPISYEEDCPVCPGQGVPLGGFGHFFWYQCRVCGMEFRLSSSNGPTCSTVRDETVGKAGHSQT